MSLNFESTGCPGRQAVGPGHLGTEAEDLHTHTPFPRAHDTPHTPKCYFSVICRLGYTFTNHFKNLILDFFIMTIFWIIKALKL